MSNSSSSVADLLGPLVRLMQFPSFNKIQTQVGPTLLTSDHNVIVSAPTGSGKTLLLEFAIMRLFHPELTATNEVASATAASPLQQNVSRKKKAVYICPIKALAYEKYTAWSTKFAPTLQVVIETGDQGLMDESMTSLEKVLEAHIIITTPERWDSITRRWKEGAALAIVAEVDLLLIDEVHIVGEARGAVLEALVSRMKAVKAATVGSKLRFVAISGTIPNVEDFARWLLVPQGCVFHFSAKDRPVKLRVIVQSFVSNSRNPFGFEKFLNYKMIPIVQQYSDGKPCLIFCPSRKETVTTATHIADELLTMAQQAGIQMGTNETAEAAERATDKQLRKCLHAGIGFHHAALSLEDRRLVETLFISQFLSVLCTTTTLAMGVNLPARLVIIKGTGFYRNGIRDDLPPTDVAQMIGRAGRPGFDTEGTAVIVTSDDKAHLYESFRNGGGDSATVVDSHLHQHMVEHVNAEISLRTISSVATAIEWLKTTFLWVRLEKAPALYGLLSADGDASNQGCGDAAPGTTSSAAHRLHQFATRLVTRIISDLRKEHCIEFLTGQTSTSGDRQDELTRDGTCMMGQHLSSTRIGKLMARLYIEFDTVKQFNEFLFDRSPRGLGSLRRSREIDVPDELLDDDDDDVEEGEGDPQPLDDHEKLKESTGLSKLCRLELAEMLELLCKASELRECRLRLGDKSFLNESNKTSVRFRINNGMKGGREVREDWHKTFILVQILLGSHSGSSAGKEASSAGGIEEPSLRNDANHLWSCLPRVAKFLVDYSIHLGEFDAIRHALTLQRCIDQRQWFDGILLTKQLAGVGDATATALARGGVRSIQDVLAADGRRIEALCAKHAPFGSEIRAKAAAIPQLTCRVVESQQHHLAMPPSTAVLLEPVTVVATSASSERVSAGGIQPLFYTLLVGDAASGRLVLYRRFRITAALFASSSSAEGGGAIRVELPSLIMQHEPKKSSSKAVLQKASDDDPKISAIEVHLLPDRFLGLDTCVKHELQRGRQKAGATAAANQQQGCLAAPLRQTKLVVSASSTTVVPRQNRPAERTPALDNRNNRAAAAGLPTSMQGLSNLDELDSPLSSPCDRLQGQVGTSVEPLPICMTATSRQSLDDLLDDSSCVYLPRRKPLPTRQSDHPRLQQRNINTGQAQRHEVGTSLVEITKETTEARRQAPSTLEASDDKLLLQTKTTFLDERSAAFDELLASKRRALLSVVSSTPPIVSSSNNHTAQQHKEDEQSALMTFNSYNKRSRSESPKFSNGGAESPSHAVIKVNPTSATKHATTGHPPPPLLTEDPAEFAGEVIDIIGQRRRGLNLQRADEQPPTGRREWGTLLHHKQQHQGVSASKLSFSDAAVTSSKASSRPGSPTASMPVGYSNNSGINNSAQSGYSSLNSVDYAISAPFLLEHHHHQHHHFYHHQQQQQPPAPFCRQAGPQASFPDHGHVQLSKSCGVDGNNSSKFQFGFVNAGKNTDRDGHRGRGRRDARVSVVSARATSGAASALDGLRRFVALQAEKVDPLACLSTNLPPRSSFDADFSNVPQQGDVNAAAAFAFNVAAADNPAAAAVTTARPLGPDSPDAVSFGAVNKQQCQQPPGRAVYQGSGEAFTFQCPGWNPAAGAPDPYARPSWFDAGHSNYHQQQFSHHEAFQYSQPPQHYFHHHHYHHQQQQQAFHNPQHFVPQHQSWVQPQFSPAHHHHHRQNYPSPGAPYSSACSFPTAPRHPPSQLQNQPQHMVSAAVSEKGRQKSATTSSWW